MRVGAKLRIAATLVGASYVALAAGDGWAQTGATAPIAVADATAAGTDLIVVTARRRDETLLETPTTLTAISGDTLNDLIVKDIQSVIALTPNAVIQRDPENFNTYINIRGIRQADVNAEPNFGLYRNGIYYGGQRSNLGALVDVARVEILRGPQAGLYGRDAVGGAVNIVYATPTQELGGYAAVRYARYQRTEVEGAVNLPIGDKFAVRATGWLFDQNKGEFYNITLGKEIDRSRDEGARLSAKATLTDRLEIVWTGEYEKNQGPSIRTYAPNGVANSVVGAPIRSAPETPRTVQRDTDGRARYRQYYVSQTINYKAGSIGDFSLLASYRDYHLLGVQDLDATPFAPTVGPGVLKQVFNRDEGVRSVYVEGLWSSPADAGPLHWTGGVSYFHEKFDIGRTFVTSVNVTPFGIPLGVLTGLGGQPIPGSRITTEAYSAFGELAYDITQSLTLTGDLRYTHDRKSLTYSQGIIPTNPATDPILSILFASALPSFAFNTRSTFGNWSPSVNLKYSFNPNANVYATYSTGFRAGGFNTTTTSAALIPYDQEKAKNYELGAKTSWLGGKLSINAAVFYMTQSNLVLAQDDPNDTLFGFTFLTNVGDTHTWGEELELLGRPASWLSAGFSVGHLHTKFTSGSSFGVSVVGNPIPYTRSWTINGRLDAAYPVADRMKLVGTANWRIETGGVLDRSFPYENLDKLDLTAGVQHGGLRVVGYVNNVFNDRVIEFRFVNGQQSLSSGRTYGVEASLRF